ncbi:DUF1772 domain-containing protein [Saccharopolyspora spinosporotrichia]|nr:DUF1772 domain-containing protein [Saccharopolyspora erythraea]
MGTAMMSTNALASENIGPVGPTVLGRDSVGVLFMQPEHGMGELGRWMTVVAGVGAGVNAGVFFAFSAVIMPGLHELPAAVAIPAMQAFNRAAVTAPFMLVLLGTAMLCVVVIIRGFMRWSTASGWWMLGGAVVYLLAAIVITGVCSVPINDAIDALTPFSSGAVARWGDLSTQWLWWNHLRALGSIGAAAALAIAIALRPSGR